MNTVTAAIVLAEAGKLGEFAEAASKFADKEEKAIAERQANSGRMLYEGARRYADADKSDPFAYARAITHIKNGVGTIDALKRDCVDSYDAETVQEKRILPDDGRSEEERTYHVVGYRNRRRP